MFYDDIKTLYDLGATDTHKITVEQTYSDARKGSVAKLDSLSYLKLQDMKAIDLDTAKEFALSKSKGSVVAKLEVPIVNERQSAHIKITGTLTDSSYKVAGEDLVFERTLHG